MSKTTVSTDVQSVTPAPQAVTQAAPVAPAAPARPGVIVLTDSTHVVFAAAAVLIRSGYVISPDAAPEVFPSLGQSTVILVRGHPDARAVAVADEAEAIAVGREALQYERDVAQAARQIVADAERAEKQRVLAVEIAESKKALRKLEQAAQAA